MSHNAALAQNDNYLEPDWVPKAYIEKGAYGFLCTQAFVSSFRSNLPVRIRREQTR